MSVDQITYLVFGLVIIAALVFDLGLLSKSSTEITLRKALFQTIFWVALAIGFFGFVWYEYNRNAAFEYLSAYLMEWSLSIDNIFVFILIFGFFKIRPDHVARALLIGILMAIVFRIIFIAVGVVLVEKFHAVLYVFGAFLIYTGIKIFTVKHEEEYNPANNIIYKLVNRVFPIIHEDVSGKLVVKRDGKRFYTNMFLVIIVLATTDIVFALDSIPAVFAIVTESPNKELIIYTSNIFAVLGLRSLFFLLKGAVNRFQYLQQGIAIVLVFIGIKMLLPIVNSSLTIPTTVSLLVIVLCLSTSIIYSMRITQKRLNKEVKIK